MGQHPGLVRVQFRAGRAQPPDPDADVLALRADQRLPELGGQAGDLARGDAGERGVLEAVGDVGRGERRHGLAGVRRVLQVLLHRLGQQFRRPQAGRDEDVDLGRVMPVQRGRSEARVLRDLPIRHGGEPVPREQRDRGGQDLVPPGAGQGLVRQHHRRGQYLRRFQVDADRAGRGGQEHVLGPVPGRGAAVRGDRPDHAEGGHRAQVAGRRRVLAPYRLGHPADDVRELGSEELAVLPVQVTGFPPVEAARGPVRDRDPDEGGEHVPQGRPGRRLVDRRDETAGRHVRALGEQRVLVREVPVQGRRRDADAGGDVLHGRRVVPALAECPARRFHDELLAVAWPRADGRAGRGGHGDQSITARPPPNPANDLSR